MILLANQIPIRIGIFQVECWIFSNCNLILILNLFYDKVVIYGMITTIRGKPAKMVLCDFHLFKTQKKWKTLLFQFNKTMSADSKVPSLSDADILALQLMKTLTADQQVALARFVAANNTLQQVDEVTHMKWVAECLAILSQTALSPTNQNALATALYDQMALSDGNKFNITFNITDAIQFITNNAANRYGIKIQKKGMFSCLPCSSVEVQYNGVDQSFHLNTVPVPAVPQ